MTAQSEIITEELPVALTTEELAARAEQLTAIADEIATVKDEKKQANKEADKRTGALELAAGRVRAEVRRKAADREVDCRWIYDYKGHIAELMRLDSGEIVQRRALTPDEVQTNIIGAIDGGKARAAARNFVETVRSDDRLESVTLSTKDKSVTIPGGAPPSKPGKPE